eukprot:2876347-Rhodomonas_salina.2
MAVLTVSISHLGVPYGVFSTSHLVLPYPTSVPRVSSYHTQLQYQASRSPVPDFSTTHLIPDRVGV